GSLDELVMPIAPASVMPRPALAGRRASGDGNGRTPVMPRSPAPVMPRPALAGRRASGDWKGRRTSGDENGRALGMPRSPPSPRLWRAGPAPTLLVMPRPALAGRRASGDGKGRRASDDGKGRAGNATRSGADGVA